METKLSELRMEFFLSGCNEITSLGNKILTDAGLSNNDKSEKSTNAESIIKNGNQELRNSSDHSMKSPELFYFAVEKPYSDVTWYKEQGDILPPRLLCRLGITTSNCELFQHAVGIIQLIALTKKKEEKVLATYKYLATPSNKDNGFVIYSPENHDKFWTESRSFFRVIYGELASLALAAINQ